MIYLINFLLVPFYYFIIKIFTRKKQTKKIFFFVAAIHAILFRAFADPYLYSDTEGYATAFLNIAEMTFDEAVLSHNLYTEWGQGYVAFNWIVSRFSRNPLVFFSITSLFSVGGVMLFYYKLTNSPLITIMFYLLYPMMYIMGFSVIRQHLAIMIVLWALYYVNNLKISIPLFLMAVSFHTTSVVFFPFFFIRNISLKKMNIIKIVFFSLVGTVLASYFIGDFLNVFERYTDVLIKKGNQSNIVPVLIIGSMLIVMYITKVFERVVNDREALIVRFLIYGLVVALFGTTIPSAGRLSLPFIYVIPVGFSVLLNNCSLETKHLNAFYIVFLFAFVCFLLTMSASGVYDNYRTIL